MYGYVKVGAAVPKLKLADCVYNKEQILEIIKEAAAKGVRVLSFPELCLTGYTCADLFLQRPLLEAAEKAVAEIAEAVKEIDMFILLGTPVALDSQAFNCAAALYKGEILGLVPKTHLPNYSEFAEERWFSSADDLLVERITYAGQDVPIGADLLFAAAGIPDLKIGVEICEDLWVPIPPSSYQALYGATLLLNLSASNDLSGKADYRKHLVTAHSSRCMAAYVYVSAGIGESTQDAVFGGHSMICENGELFSETERFSRENQLIYADIDLEILTGERRKHTTFLSHLQKAEMHRFYRLVTFDMTADDTLKNWSRPLTATPFHPNAENEDAYCKDIFSIQTVGLARRMEHTHSDSLVIGISGGLDSTLALLVCVKACDYLGIDRSKVLGVTMPGFGTTDRTYQNALTLMKSLGITMKEIPIRDAVTQHFKDIDHDINLHNVTYENAQARERTQILMDLANKYNGLVVGTGDLSELALGWATYNGDHMSMYGVNGGIPKTLIRVLVKWVATNGEVDADASAALLDVLDTPVSPELLPPDKDGKINQKTEDLVGPYELHDFFLYYILHYGYHPAKILFLAEKAFNGEYDRETLLKWLKNFYRRFFIQQFKRSCLPDGPKVGDISLSPRGDWRMPTDAVSRIWMDEVEKL
ncbi:NAD(+) synthase [Anaerotignum sp.]|nr:NAD(+) synthase [Anaerotignum sp.]MBQ7759370.1 NAD(+) synthase [Anaerotignum sp.]